MILSRNFPVEHLSHNYNTIIQSFSFDLFTDITSRLLRERKNLEANKGYEKGTTDFFLPEKKSTRSTYDSEVFGFPVEGFGMIVPVSSRSGSNYGFVAAHWPPRRYRANRVLLSHANSPATAVIASGRGLTSNTSWLVFSTTDV